MGAKTLQFSYFATALCTYVFVFLAFFTNLTSHSDGLNHIRIVYFCFFLDFGLQFSRWETKLQTTLEWVPVNFRHPRA